MRVHKTGLSVSLCNGLVVKRPVFPIAAHEPGRDQAARSERWVKSENIGMQKTLWNHVRPPAARLKCCTRLNSLLWKSARHFLQERVQQRVKNLQSNSLQKPISFVQPRSPTTQAPHARTVTAAAEASPSSTSKQQCAAGLSYRVARYNGLTGDDFRHPLDQQNTTLLRALPGVEAVAKNLMGPVAEQVLLLENISTSVLVGPQQLPHIHALLIEAAAILQMEPPDLYIRQNPIPNAYTLAISGRKPFIVVHTSLLEIMSPEELQSVLAHELGHLKCDHGLWLTAANVLAMGTVSLLPIISNAVEDTLLRWLRSAELTCDRAALLVAQNPKTVVSALMKLAGGSPSIASQLNVDAFLQQARSYDEATSSPLGWYLRNAQTRGLSHPLPVMRAKEIDKWAQSAQFKGLLSRSSNERISTVGNGTAGAVQSAANSVHNGSGNGMQQGGNGSKRAAQDAGNGARSRSREVPVTFTE